VSAFSTTVFSALRLSIGPTVKTAEFPPIHESFESTYGAAIDTAIVATDYESDQTAFIKAFKPANVMPHGSAFHSSLCSAECASIPATEYTA
jgi:hypothetical protein